MIAQERLPALRRRFSPVCHILGDAGLPNVYAEGLRRGGALVSAKVDDADAARIQGIMDRSSVRVADRAAAYRKTGWTTYDPSARPFTRDEVIRERSLYR